MSTKLIGLTTVITYVTETRGRRQVVVGSNCYIAIKTDKGNIGVASAVLGGKCQEKDVLSEFKKAPQRFKQIEPGYSLAKAASLI